MAEMTDPMIALTSFQEVLLQDLIHLQRGVADPELFVFTDELPDGQMRLTYVKLDGKTVAAFANLVLCDPVDGTPCFQIGYAVPEAYRCQGRATNLVRAALSEMQRGFACNVITEFYVEAVVGTDNLPSQHVAKQTISSKSTEIIDEFSGQPALQYLRKVGPSAP